MLAGRVIHYSHRLMWYRGITYCLHCGYYSQGLRVSKLAKRCRMKPAHSQLPLLKRMKAGMAPTNRGWPKPEEEQCPSLFRPYVAYG